jgi:hypothetical protein
MTVPPEVLHARNFGRRCHAGDGHARNSGRCCHAIDDNALNFGRCCHSGDCHLIPVGVDTRGSGHVFSEGV